jgi:hypothetical protein
MSSDYDLDYGFIEEELYPDYSSDPAFLSCKADLRKFFKRKRTPYYLTQLEVLFEKRYFHWITYRAIKSLVSDGYLDDRVFPTKYGSSVIFVFRPPSDDQNRQRVLSAHINSKLKLIESFSEPQFTAIIGRHLQYLFKSELRANQFTIICQDCNEFQGKKWTETGHDLDFIATHHEGFSIGVECKNTLPYIPKDELDLKIRMCAYLGIKPVFILRWAPKSYIYEVYTQGGFCLLLEFQLYPLAYNDRADKIIQSLNLPIMVAPEIRSDAQIRFANWVNKQK